MNLTPKQHRFLGFIEDFSSQKGYAPSQVEIARHFGYTSLGTIQNYLNSLEAKGYLARQKYCSRSLQLNELETNSTRIPLQGTVAAGKPIEAIETHESVDVPPALLKGGVNFALKVKGDSMIDEGIHEGDTLIVRKQASADNGQIVVALLGNEATVKTFFKRKDHIELKPANARLSSIVVEPTESFQLLGVVVGLMRRYS